MSGPFAKLSGVGAFNVAMWAARPLWHPVFCQLVGCQQPAGFLHQPGVWSAGRPRMNLLNLSLERAGVGLVRFFIHAASVVFFGRASHTTAHNFVERMR